MYLYQSKQYIHVFIDLSLLQFRTQLQMSELLSGGKMDFASEHGLGLFVLCVKVGLYIHCRPHRLWPIEFNNIRILTLSCAHLSHLINVYFLALC